jgi:hypothetical protein
MKIILFTIVNWDTQEEADNLKEILNEWNLRKQYFHPSYSFIVAGSVSDPKYNPLPQIPLIQTHIDKQFFPKTPINYWKCGLMTGLHHCLYQLDNVHWDLAIYYHYCVLNSLDFTNIFTQFLSSSKSICAINKVSSYGSVIDTGLMIMKLSGVQKWILNSSSGFLYTKTGKSVAVEKEADLIFKEDIFNPLPEIISMHRYQTGGHTKEDQKIFYNRFNLSQHEFIQNPIIFGYKHHCSKDDLFQWKKLHPYTAERMTNDNTICN